METPSSSAEERRLIFLHVPKTAGTTLKTILVRQYHREEIAKCYYHKPGRTMRGELNRILCLPKHQTDKIKIVMGHMGYGLHEHLPWPCTYFTVLRDPIDRAISSYYQIRRARLDNLRDEAQRLSLKDFISSGLLKAMDNGQTRLVSGAAVEEDLLGKEVEYGRCTVEMLERAKKNLDSFAAIGISEHFDESLMLMKQVFGWSRTFYVKANVGRNKAGRQVLSKDTLDCLERYNEFDRQLYEHATKLFAKAIADQEHSFQRKISSFRLVNRIYGDAQRVKGAVEKLARLG